MLVIEVIINKWLSMHHQNIVLRFSYIQYISYKFCVSLNYTSETYVNHVQGLFWSTLYKYSEIRQMFHAGLFMLRKTNGARRALCRATFLSEFSDTDGVRRFSSAFYRWLLPNNSRFYRRSSLTNQKFLSEH